MMKSDSGDPEDDLARAEAEIYGRLQPSQQRYPATPARPTGTTSPGPVPAPPTNDHTEAPQQARPAEEGDDGGEGDVCQTACDALASMQRAVERICALAGSTTDRCRHARERFARAKETVESRCEECDS